MFSWTEGVLELNEEVRAIRIRSRENELVYSSFFEFDFSVSDRVFTFVSLTSRIFVKVRDIQQWLVKLWKVVR